MEYKIKPKIDSCHNNYFKNIFLQQNASIFSYQIQIFFHKNLTSISFLFITSPSSKPRDNSTEAKAIHCIHLHYHDTNCEILEAMLAT